MKKIQRQCVNKKCACKFNLAKIARKDLPWAQLVGSQDFILMPSSTSQVENGYTSNSLVLMNLGDKLGKKIVEAKDIDWAWNQLIETNADGIRYGNRFLFTIFSDVFF